MNGDLHIPQWLRRLWTSPVGELTRWQRTVKFSIDLARHCAGELRHDKAAQMAAALTYHTLFSLLPTIVLAMLVLNAFVGEQERQRFKQTVVEFLLPEATLSVRENETISTRHIELSEARRELAARVQRTMDSIQQINFEGIGLVGLLVFIYGATALLSTMEHSFNAIFGVERGRPWYVRLPLYYTVITLSPVVLIAAQVLQARMLGVLKAEAWTNWLVGPAAVVTPVAATWLVLFLMYVLLPNTRVGKRSAAVGGLVAAVLWVVMKDLFRLYVSHAAVTTLYGALALLPLFLLWLWLTWLVVLFGLELTYTLGAMRGRRLKHEAHKGQEEMLDAMWAVPLAARVAQHFEGGRSCDPEELSRSLNMPPRAVRRILGALAGAGLVHRVDDGEAEGFSLARPADRITVRQVLDSARTLLAPNRDPDPGAPGGRATGGPDAAWELVDRLHEAEDRAAEATTLADLCPGKRADETTSRSS